MLLLALLAAAIDPCKLVTAEDITRLTGWVATAPPSKKRYHLPQESGTTCSFTAQEGVVVITVPDGDSAATASGVYANPLSNGSATQVHIRDGYAEIFNNSAFIDKHHRHAVVKILPLSDQATPEVLTAAAELVARRLP